MKKVIKEAAKKEHRSINALIEVAITKYLKTSK